MSRLCANLFMCDEINLPISYDSKIFETKILEGKLIFCWNYYFKHVCAFFGIKLQEIEMWGIKEQFDGIYKILLNFALKTSFL